MAKERQVTRRVIESKKYNVYKMEGLQLVLLDTIEEKGKVSEKELAKKYKVDKVFIDCIEEKKAVYGMEVTEFMKYAKFIKYEEAKEADAENTEEADAENNEQSETESK